MILSSDNDDRPQVESQIFLPAVHGPRTREVDIPSDFLLDSPNPTNIGDLRLPVFRSNCVGD